MPLRGTASECPPTPGGPWPWGPSSIGSGNAGWSNFTAPGAQPPDGRIKPDLAAPTGVSTVSYGRLNIRQGGGYFGTSASAPHVAGAAALVKSANPSFSRTQLRNALIAATVDIGTGGMDNDSGHGKLVLPVQEPSPRITSVSPRRVRYNQVVTIRGSGFGDTRGSSSVRIGWTAVPFFTSWSNSRIQFRIPVNTRSRKPQRQDLGRDEQRPLPRSDEPLPEPGISHPRRTRGPSDPDGSKFQIDSRLRIRPVCTQRPPGVRGLPYLERPQHCRRGSIRGGKRKREGRYGFRVVREQADNGWNGYRWNRSRAQGFSATIPPALRKIRKASGSASRESARTLH